jgi:hypothetical protein
MADLFGIQYFIFFIYIFIPFLFIIFTIINLTLPIINLIYANKYRDEIICSLNTNTTNNFTQSLTFNSENHISNNFSDMIGIYNWMIIYGSIFIIHFIIFLCNLIFFVNDNDTKAKKIIYRITCSMLFVTNLFVFPWLIIGILLFSKNCPNIHPYEINELTYITVIIESIFSIIKLIFAIYLFVLHIIIK